MKRTLLLVLFISIMLSGTGGLSFAQEYTWYNSYAPGLRDNKVFINAGVGLGPTRSYSMGIPPLTASVDVKVSNTLPITAGAFVTFCTWEYSHSGSTGAVPGIIHELPPSTTSTYYYDLTYTNIGIGARGMYHFNFVRNLDVYAGLVLGYVIQNSSVSYGGAYNSSNAPRYSGQSFFLYGINSGARFFFTNRIGIYTEFGYSGLQYLGAGLSIKI